MSFGQQIENLVHHLAVVATLEAHMIAQLANAQAALAALAPAVQNANALMNSLSAQLTALAQQPTISPADVQALADQINAQTALLSSTTAADTPAAPAVAPAPPAASAVSGS